MPRFNHACTIAFEVISNEPDGDDVTPAMLREALLKRIATLDADESQWIEAVGAPFDTFEIEE